MTKQPANVVDVHKIRELAIQSNKKLLPEKKSRILGRIMLVALIIFIIILRGAARRPESTRYRVQTSPSRRGTPTASPLLWRDVSFWSRACSSEGYA